MKNQNKSYFFAILAVLIWSTVASAFKISLEYLTYFQLLFFSSFVSLIALFIILFFQGKVKLLARYRPKDYFRSALLGFLNPFLYYILLFKAYSILPAQKAITLNYTWPIMLVLLSIPILKQKIKLTSIFAIVISFFGVILISTKGNFSSLQLSNIKGDLLPLGSAIIWALFWIFNIKDKRDIVPKMFLNFAFGFVFILIISLFRNFENLFYIQNFNGIFGTIYVGIFEMGITFVIWLKALKLSKTTARVSNFIYFTPFLSLLIVSILIDETILFSTIIGLIFIVIGIIIQQYNNSKEINGK